MRKLKTIKSDWNKRALDLREGDEIEIIPFESVSAWTHIYTYLVTAVGELKTRLLDYDTFSEEREVCSEDLWKMHQNKRRGRFPQMKLKRRGHIKSTKGETLDIIGEIRSSPNCSSSAEDNRTQRRERRRKKQQNRGKKRRRVGVEWIR